MSDKYGLVLPYLLSDDGRRRCRCCNQMIPAGGLRHRGTAVIERPIHFAGPDLLFPEVGNILWKHICSGEVTNTEGEAVLQALGKLPLIVHPSWPLILSALEIAYRISRTVYDSLYLALAVRENTKLITADKRLYNALTSTPLAAHRLWVEHVV